MRCYTRTSKEMIRRLSSANLPNIDDLIEQVYGSAKTSSAVCRTSWRKQRRAAVERQVCCCVPAGGHQRAMYLALGGTRECRDVSLRVQAALFHPAERARLRPIPNRD